MTPVENSPVKSALASKTLAETKLATTFETIFEQH